MDRRRAFSPAHLRHGSEELFTTATTTRNGSSSPSRDFPSSKPNHATAFDRKKASYARLSRVMKTTTFDDDDDDGDLAPRPLHTLRRPTSLTTDAAALSRRPKRYPVVKSDQKADDSSLQVETSTTEPSPSLPVKTSPVESHSVQPSKLERPLQVEAPAVIQSSEPPIDRSRDDGLPRASRLVGRKESLNNYEASKLRDELDMLQYENERINEKLRLAEERCDAAEARSRQHEKQVASFGNGISLEAKLLSRKEAELREREEALRIAEGNKDANDEEVIALRQELKAAKNEAEAAIEQLHEAEYEARTLNSITKRMILTQEEMEEIVLKRCWLAHYWGLAVRFGLYLDIAPSKHEYWSFLVPLPYEVVIAAAQKAKEESTHQGKDDFERNKPIPDLSDITTENTIESMLVVEKGLRELASLQVEHAVVLTMANCRRPNLVRESSSDLPSAEGPRFEVELSMEESDDVLFKQAWLAYYWGRAKNHGVEEDIAEECLQYWCRQRTSPLTTHDAVDVERGLIELRKLGIEEQLWEASGRENDGSLLLPNHRDSES